VNWRFIFYELNDFGFARKEDSWLALEAGNAHIAKGLSRMDKTRCQVNNVLRAYESNQCVW
jgi:hypothetical protein